MQYAFHADSHHVEAVVKNIALLCLVKKLQDYSISGARKVTLWTSELLCWKNVTHLVRRIVLRPDEYT